MRLLAWLSAMLIVVAIVAVVAQEVRYLNKRRDIVHDQQSLFYSGQAFHVVTLVKLAAGQPLQGSVGELVENIESHGGKTVYAGKIVVHALQSKQIPQQDWNAFVLVQYPDRQRYEVVREDAGYQRAKAVFAATYTLGMERPAAFNLAMPVVLLGMRARDILTGHPARYPFEPAGQSAALPGQLAARDRIVNALLDDREWGKDALVILNFIKQGDTSAQSANADYGAAMIAMLAEVGGGPMHFGRAVTLEGDAEFDQVAIVYYPGVAFFADMVRSEFFTSIIGGKQLGDTLSSPSVPLLPHL